MANHHHNNKEVDGDLERNVSSIYRNDPMGGDLSKTVSIDAELFERLYLQPKNTVTGDLRTTFANPTPLALLGFSVGLLPITTAFMGWRGAGAGAANAQATTPATIWFGGMLLIIAGFMEWILGNFFPFVVFMGYGAHFLTLGTTFIPFFHALASFTTDGSETITPDFAAGYGFYPLVLAMLSFAFLLGSLRTNLVFVLIFVAATIGFSMAAAGFWYIKLANLPFAIKMFQGAGGCFFAASLFGWYLFFGAIIANMELPIPDLPVFDMSNVVKGRKRGGASRKEIDPAEP